MEAAKNILEAAAARGGAAGNISIIIIWEYNRILVYSFYTFE